MTDVEGNEVDSEASRGTRESGDPVDDSEDGGKGEAEDDEVNHVC